MIRWFTRLRDRPIANGERHAAMAAVVLLLTATALLLALTRPGGQPPHGNERAAQGPLGRRAAVHPRLSRDGAAPLTPVAARAARLFLYGYLRYLYGDTPASPIEDATAGLVHSLKENPPRVRPGAQADHARLLSLHGTPAPPGQLGVIAVVNTGGLVDYPVGLLLSPHGARLLVSGLEGE